MSRRLHDAVVLGCGPVGVLAATAMVSAGLRVLMLCKRSERAARLRYEGLRVRGMGRDVSARVDAEKLRMGVKYSSDFAVVALRSDDLELLDSASIEAESVIYVQPSLILKEKLAAAGSGLLALYGCAWINSEDGSVGYAAGSIRYAGKVPTGLLGGFLRLGFRDAGPAEPLPLLWDYAAAHAAVQPVSALLGVAASKLRVSEHGLALVDAAAREALLVMEKAGVRLLRSPVDAARELVAVQGCYPAMLRDIEARRPTEVDYMNALIVKEALRLGVYAAYNDALYLAVKALEEVSEIRGPSVASLRGAGAP